jgi:biopolymer transport protein ExbD
MKFKGRIEQEYGLRNTQLFPLLNIFFLLFIFFLFSRNFILAPALGVNLPRVVTSSAIGPRNLEVLLSAEGKLYFSGREVDIQALAALCREAARRGEGVLIKADRDAALGKLARACDIAREAGVSAVNIATNE